MLVGFAIPFLLALVSRGGMGVVISNYVRLWVFWLGFPGIFQAIFLGATLGGILGIILLITKVKNRKDPIPFGPFLMIGFLQSFFSR